MKERPIVFSTEEVQACLAGQLTRFRRPVVPQPWAVVADARVDADGHIVWAPVLSQHETVPRRGGKPCPYGVPGDRLWPAMEIPSLGRNYCADTTGSIWSRARDSTTWRRLKGSLTSKGYLSVTPAVGGKYKTRSVHRLVAEAFYGYEPDGLRQVRHLDGSQLNNAPENLDWGTQQDNWSDRLVHGRGAGESHHAAKLTAEQAAEIRASGAPQRHLAAWYGVSQSTVRGVKNGCCWCENPKANPPNMPRWATRLLLEVTEVRVARVPSTTNTWAWVVDFKVAKETR